MTTFLPFSYLFEEITFAPEKLNGLYFLTHTLISKPFIMIRPFSPQMLLQVSVSDCQNPILIISLSLNETLLKCPPFYES